MSYYFVGYPDRSKCYRFYCPSQNTKVVESINCQVLENDDFSESTKVRDTIFEEQRGTVIVPIVLNMIDDVSVERA